MRNEGIQSEFKARSPKQKIKEWNLKWAEHITRMNNCTQVKLVRKCGKKQKRRQCKTAKWLQHFVEMMRV